MSYCFRCGERMEPDAGWITIEFCDKNPDEYNDDDPDSWDLCNVCMAKLKTWLKEKQVKT
jgi:hypothetical protein